MAVGKLELFFLEITHFYNSFIMLYIEYFTLQDCSGFLQIRSHMCVAYTDSMLFKWPSAVIKGDSEKLSEKLKF